MIELDDLHFHLTLDGSRMRNISNVEILKMKVTYQWRWELEVSISHDNVCEKSLSLICATFHLF